MYYIGRVQETPHKIKSSLWLFELSPICYSFREQQQNKNVIKHGIRNQQTCLPNTLTFERSSQVQYKHLNYKRNSFLLPIHNPDIQQLYRVIIN